MLRASVYVAIAVLMIWSTCCVSYSAERITSLSVLLSAARAARQIDRSPIDGWSLKIESLLKIAELQSEADDEPAVHATLSDAIQATALVTRPTERCELLGKAMKIAIYIDDPLLETAASKDLESRIHGWIGVGTADETDGALVTNVIKASPASAAGVHFGDVIIAVNDERITDSRGFGEVIVRFQPRERIDLHLMRGSEARTINVEVGARPQDQDAQTVCREKKIEVLCQAAELQAKLGNLARSAALVRRASEELSKIPSGENLIALVVEAEVLTGDPNAALVMAAGAEDPPTRAHLLGRIADVLIQIGETQRVPLIQRILSQAREIVDEKERAEILGKIALVDSLIGDFAAAHDILTELGNTGKAVEIAVAIAEAEAKRDPAAAMANLREALQRAMKLEDAKSRDQALEIIARAQDKTGFLPELLAAIAHADAARNIYTLYPTVRAAVANNSTSEALRAVALLPQGEDRVRAELIQDIAVAEARKGNIANALRIGGQKGETRVEILLATASYYFESGNLPAAHSSIERADAIVKGLVRNGTPIENWTSRIIEAKASTGDIRGARSLVAKIPDPLDRARSLESVLVSQSEALQNFSDLRKTVDEIIANMLQSDHAFRGHYAIWAAELLLKVHEGSRVDAFIKSVSPCGLCDDHEGFWAPLATVQDAELLVPLAAAQAKAGSTAAAIATLAKARGRIASSPRANLRASALQEVALTQASLGDIQGTLDWSTELPTPEEQSSALLGVAEAMLTPEQRGHVKLLDLAMKFGSAIGSDGDTNVEARSDAIGAAQGSAANSRNEIDKRLRQLDELIRRAPRNVSAYAERGALYEADGYREKAIGDYSKVIQILPQATEGYLSRAQVFYALKKYEQAKADLLHAIRLDPADDRAHFKLGLIYIIQKSSDLAISSFDRAVAINPHLVGAYKWRAIAHMERRMYDPAIVDCTAALELDPVNAEHYNCRAWATLKAGRAAGGLSDADQALALNPTYANAYDTRAHIFEATGDVSRAADDYRKALSFDPELTESKEGLRRLGITP